MSEADRFERYVARLTDTDALALHRIASRRAAAIYGPMYADRQKWGYETAMALKDTRFRPPAHPES